MSQNRQSMERAGQHKLENIIAIAIRAVISGADSWGDIESFGNAQLDRFETFLELPNGIPSRDTFGRVFSLIDAQIFQDALAEWTKRVWEAAQSQVVAIDGETVQRSEDKANGKSAIHMAGAWATENGVSLGQVKTDDRSNEITAIPEPLKTLEIAGCVAAIDAMGCQKKTARQVVKRSADYVPAVKKNQPKLRESAAGAFERGDMEHDRFETVNKGHGRVERRRCWATSAPSVIGQANGGGEWANMNGAAVIKSTLWSNGKTSVHRRRFITSLPPRADKILRSVRERWGAENGLNQTPARRSGRTGA